MMMRLLSTLVLSAFLILPAHAQQTPYKLQPGDVLDISIWGQEASRRQVVVLPDGTISYPLAGQMPVVGRTVTDIESELRARMVKGGFFLEKPELTVAVLEPRGHQIFVLGRVRGPGALTATRRLSVAQALSLAGGLDKFANAEKLVVIRRTGNGQEVVPIDYAAISTGSDLSTNIILQPGDVLIVPEDRLF